VPVRFLKSSANIVLLRVNFTSGEPETYIIPVMIEPMEYAGGTSDQYPGAVIAQVKMQDGDKDQICFDAMVDKDFCSFLLESIGQQRSFKGVSGEICAIATRAFRNIRDLAESSLVPNPVKTEQTNTSITYGSKAILKLLRRIEDGVIPEMEIGLFLTERTSFANFPPLLGALEYRIAEKPVKSVAVLQSFVPNKGDAWQYTLASLDCYFQSISANPGLQAPPIPRRHLLSILRKPTLLAREKVGTYLTSAQLLGQRTAELHKALSSVTDNPDFAPEPFSTALKTSLYRSFLDLTLRTFQVLEEKKGCCPGDIYGEIERILKSKDAIIKRFQQATSQNIPAVFIRCHGDYHLGQVLYTGKDFVIIDFEGEPGLPLSERRSKRSPLQDVAGMLRSFDYASQSELNRQVIINSGRNDVLQVLPHWAWYWCTWVSINFLKSYLKHIREAHLLPENPGQLKLLLDAYLLEKNIYEIGYELNNRPDWLRVPVHGILQLLESS
jgi:maltose alpha-D-glucosyltransferase/alpha-amylase